MPNLLGTAPNQVPTNADLGKLAFMDVVDTVTNNPYLDTAISDTKPSLLLDFANSKTLDPRITYTRASTASYYDGKTTAVAEQNLLTYSEQFDNAAWTKLAASVTANSIAAPDGTTTADLVLANTSATSHGVYQNYSVSNATQYTISVYAKAQSYDKLYISDANVGGFACSFDLTAVSSGTPTGGFSNKSASITSIGNGWYKCFITFTATSSSIVSIALVGYPAGATLGIYGANYTGDGTSGIYIWGAQLEQRSSVSSYTPTTSSPITNYIPALQTAAAGVPRFDHDPITGESKGFLTEEQRTNLLTYSADFSNAAWTKGNTTVIADTTVAPDGTLTGDKLVEDTANAVHVIYTIPSGSGIVRSCTIFAKAGERRYVTLQTLYNSNGYNTATFDLISGSVTQQSSGSSATITSVGNGWFRLYINQGSYAGTNTVGVSLSTTPTPSSDSYGRSSYTGDGYSGIYIWGAQLEAGSFATSYIPTTSAQVTRSADAASITGTNFSSWYRPDQGTIMAITQRPYSAVSGNAGVATLYADSSNIYLLNYNTSTIVEAYVRANGTTIADITASSWSVNTDTKHALGYAVNDFAASFNGSAVGTDTSGALPVGVNSLYIGVFQWSTQYYLNGTIKRLAYYPKRLSDAELQEMTL